MKCKNCEHFTIKYWGSGSRKSFDGHKCGLMGYRVNEESIISDCPKNSGVKPEKKKAINPDDQWIRVD